MNTGNKTNKLIRTLLCLSVGNVSLACWGQRVARWVGSPGVCGDRSWSCTPSTQQFAPCGVHRAKACTQHSRSQVVQSATHHSTEVATEPNCWCSPDITALRKQFRHNCISQPKTGDQIWESVIPRSPALRS
eukprot:947586-Amphidinium_carterae.2